MATGIPLPGQPINSLMTGINTGSSMFARLMQPIIEREKQKQLESHFQEELKLRKAAAARAGANSDIQRQVLQEQLIGLKHGNDPNWALQQKLNALKAFGMGGESTPGQPAPQESFGEGQGMFTPEGLQDAQQVPEAPIGGMGGFNPEQFKKNPLLRFLFKQQFGADPLAVAPQTPEEKNQAAIDLFKQKEAIKASGKATGATALTNPIKTKYQSVMGGARSALPIIDKLIAQTRKGEIPGQMFGSMFKRDAQANYMGEVSTLLDGIRNAYTIPNTDSGTAKAEDKVLRKRGESDDNYIKRLQTIRAQIVDREADARTKLSSGNITTQSEPTDYSSMSDEELRRIAGGG